MLVCHWKQSTRGYVYLIKFSFYIQGSETLIHHLEEFLTNELLFESLFLYTCVCIYIIKSILLTIYMKKLSILNWINAHSSKLQY
jgi:hypothetical protein